MQQLTDSEAALIFLQDSTRANSIGALIELTTKGRPELDLDALSDLTAKRLHLFPRLRQHIVEAPARLDHPYWCDDGHFNLQHHLQEVQLPAANFEAQLLGAAGRLLAQPLPIARPLWSVTLLRTQSHAIEEPRAALLIRYHPVMVDTRTGDEPVGVLLDPVPEGRHLGVIPPWQPEARPSRLQMLQRISFRPGRMSGRFAGIAKEAAARRLYYGLIRQWRQMALPRALFKTRLTPFNRILGRDRLLAQVRISYSRVRDLKLALSHTTTTAILITLCAEALQRMYSLQQFQITALTPVSIRSRHIESPTGSQLASMLLPLGESLTPPLQRLWVIESALKSSDAFGQAVAADRLQGIAPAALAALAGRNYLAFQLAQRHRPVFNLPIINIPGKQRLYYLEGRPVNNYTLINPLFDGLGLAMTLLTVGNEIRISLTGTKMTLPDAPGACQQAFDAAIDALEKAADPLDWEKTRQMRAGKSGQEESLTGAIVHDTQQVFHHLRGLWPGRTDVGDDKAQGRRRRKSDLPINHL